MQRSLAIFVIGTGLSILLAGCMDQDASTTAQANPVPREAAGGVGESGPSEEHAEASGEEPELALYMSQLQRWLHKSALSVQARNAELSGFYLHELEETTATIQEEAPIYEGYPVGSMSNQILMPTIEALEEAIADQDWSGADARLSDVTEACNQCHTATEHGFIQIQTDDLANPYAQSFEPQGSPN